MFQQAGRTLRRTPYETFVTFVRSFENWFVRRYRIIALIVCHSEAQPKNLLFPTIGKADASLSLSMPRRVGSAGADTVHADSLHSIVERHLPRQVDDRGFGRAVSRILFRCQDAECRSGIDDGATALAEKMGQHGTRTVVNRIQIQVQDEMPLHVLQVANLAADAAAGVVVKYVQVAEVIQSSAYGLGPIGFTGGIGF